MACACSKKKGNTFKVQLPGGLSVIKATESAALAFAARHPGAKVVKAA